MTEFCSHVFKTPVNQLKTGLCQISIPSGGYSIGRESFATVSILSGFPVVFKHVMVREVVSSLNPASLQVLRSLYDCCDADSFFDILRPGTSFLRSA